MVRAGAQACSEEDDTDTEEGRRDSAAEDKRQGKGCSAMARQRGKGMALGTTPVPTSYKYLKKFILRLKRKWLRVLRRTVTERPIYMGEAEEADEGEMGTSKDTAPVARQAVCRQTLEIGAVCINVHVRICAGGAGKLAFLPQPAQT